MINGTGHPHGESLDHAGRKPALSHLQRKYSRAGPIGASRKLQHDISDEIHSKQLKNHERQITKLEQQRAA